MYKLHKMKGRLIAAFPHIKGELKSLKYVYFLSIVLTSTKISNIYIFIIINLVVNTIITYIWIKYKLPTQKEIDLTFLDTEIETNLKFDEVVQKVKPPKQMELPFLLGSKDGKPIFADLLKNLHTLIAGTTGKGKSNFINQFIQSLMLFGKGNLAFFLCDMKQIELVDYKAFSCCRYLNKAEELLKVLIGLREEMQSRYIKFMNVIEGQKAFKNLAEYLANTNDELSYALLLIDEFGDINDLEDEDLKSSIWREIRWILREGRAAGIIIVLATQRPTKENITPQIKNLMASFIGFGVRDGNESGYCGVKGSVGLPVGEIIVNSEGYDNVKFKTYYINPHDGIYYKLYNLMKD